MISIWLLQFEIWIIIGIIFILLELTDGSAIFFLPLGIGSLILSLYIYLCNIELVSESLILETWYFALVVWAILSLITSILISNSLFIFLSFVKLTINISPKDFAF